MKNILLMIISIWVLQSCGNNSADQEIVEKDSTMIEDAPMVWQAGLSDSTGRLEMKQVPPGEPGLSDMPSLVEYLNRTNPNITLNYLRTSNDTAYLQIPDAEYLTQRMGSSGSLAYMAGIVYNLTELPGIHFVNLDFEEGDHASPGTFSRETFRNN